MDNITHTLTGLMLARCGLGKTTPRGAGMLMIAANIPDIDAVTWFDRLRYLEFHRSYTHSLAFAPLMALLPLALVRARFTWKTYLAALAGVLSHVLIDWTNPYGIQMLLPFSARRVRLDITNLFDVWIWLFLFLGLLAPALVQLVNSEMKSRTAAGPYRAWAWFALLAFLSVDAIRFAAHQRALGMLESRLYQGAPPGETIAIPASSANPFAWRGIVRGAGFVTILPVNVRREFDPGAGRTFYDPPADARTAAAIASARQSPAFQVMLKFSQAQFWKVTPESDGTLVELVDLRFGSPDGAGFAAVSKLVR